MKNDKKYVVFLDSVSRTIIGEVSEKKNKKLTVKNPTIINVVPIPSEDPNAGPKMSIQLVPVFFRELLLEKNIPVVFEYNLDSITVSDISKLEDHVIENYESLYAPINSVATVEEVTEG